MKDCKVRLKNGTIITGDEFDTNDFLKLKEIFKKWLNINADLKSLKGRGLNVPDVFSEALFCIAFDAVRTNNDPGARSYDCVIKATGEGVQVKSASISTDCTSFGPTSTWDLLYYADFAPNGYVDGNVWFYKIDSDDVYGLILNNKKNETFADQQAQGRRPRFSIQSSIIRKKGLKPIKKMSLVD
ncbi:MAG: Bsp6I family restriction endonuclease [Clostridia bacterium]|nr:Bsp6I family restriction endonuclease [Clostridia bacterium]